MTKKADYPTEHIRHWLEPGPVVLISSQREAERNIMTLGWHTILEFSPSLVGCMIASGNHSYDIIRESGECVINLPTEEMAQTVARIGNCSGAREDKFQRFGLTEEQSQVVRAPGIAECHACFECRLYDDAMVEKYNFFIFEVVKARVRPEPKWPRTLHYAGAGQFRTDGEVLDCKKWFTKVS